MHHDDIDAEACSELMYRVVCSTVTAQRKWALQRRMELSNWLHVVAGVLTRATCGETFGPELMEATRLLWLQYMKYVLSSIGMYSFKSIPTIMKKLTCTAIWGCGAHQYVKDLATLPIDFIALPLKDAANKEVMQKVPILPPHLLSNWLLQAGLLTFDQRATA